MTISINGIPIDGSVIGPASTTVNAVARWGNTTGGQLKNSPVTVSDAGQIAGVALPTLAGMAMAVPPGVADGDMFVWSGGTLVRVQKGAANEAWLMDPTGTAPAWTTLPSSGGDVVGPGTSTPTAFSRFANGKGKLLADSGVVCDGSNNVSGMATLTLPNTGLHILDTNASHDLIIVPGSDLTADRNLTLTTGDAARAVTLASDADFAGTANTFGGGDGTKFTTRTATQTRTSLLPAAYGTLAARPAAAVDLVGTTYYVETGASLGDLYLCKQTGAASFAWQLVGFTERAPGNVGSGSPDLWWKLNEAAGTTAANSGTLASGNLTIFGTPDLTLPGPFSDESAGVAPTFPGTSGTPPAVRIWGAPAAIPATTRKACLMAWIRPVAFINSFDTIAIKAHAATGSWPSPYITFGMALTGAGLLRMQTNVSGSLVSIDSTTAVSRFRWTHVAVVFDGDLAAASRGAIYLDGELINRGTLNTTDLAWNANGDWQIGASGEGSYGEPFSGRIADVRLYSSTAVPTARQLREFAQRGVGQWQGAS